VWLPWMAGPHEETAQSVLVSLTEFRAHAWRDLPRMAWIGLALRAGWYGLPGAVGLYLWTDFPQRCVGSLSVWTDAADRCSTAQSTISRPNRRLLRCRAFHALREPPRRAAVYRRSCRPRNA
jgi:hypothetical protein